MICTDVSLPSTKSEERLLKKRWGQSGRGYVFCGAENAATRTSDS